jgi:PAS domain S-box-containing protein
MMSNERLTYEELEQRLTEAQQIIAALRGGEVDAIISEQGVSLLRLKDVENALRRSEENFRNSMETSPLGIRIVTAEGELLYGNQAMLDIYGYSSFEELRAAPAKQRYTPESYAEHEKRKEKRKRGEHVPSDYEISVVRKDGEIRHLEVFRTEVLWNGKTEFQMLYRDITERKLAELASKRAEEALRVSEDRFRSEFKGNPIPAYIWQKAGDDFVLVDFNAAAEAMTHGNMKHCRGVEASVVYSDRPDIIVDLARCCTERCTISREMLYTFQSTRETRFLFVCYVFIPSNEIVVYAEDITERKLAEQQLKTSQDQLRALAAYLQNVREDERTAIAREIHDELGQVLTALKMDLSLLEKAVAEQSIQLQSMTISAEIREMSGLVGSAIRTVQRLVRELRPETLDILGLVDVLRWQAEQFQQHTQINCELSLPTERVALDVDRSTGLFRIFQEALSNVARHSNATTVLVKLVVEPEAVVLKIEDNGRGISESEIADARSFGILGMRERAIGFGGNVEVRGIPGKGTAVTARISRG